MDRQNRREFLQNTAAAAAGLMASGQGQAAQANRAATGMRLGLIIGAQKDPDAAIAKVHELGLPTCQASTEDFSPELADRLKAALEKYGVEATAINTSGPGPNIYDFYQGPLTIGVVPPKTRRARIDHLKRASDFAKLCGVGAVHTHFGFIPENPNELLYTEAVAACREVASHIKGNDQMVLYETGQETPITLLRLIEDVELDNQGINLDTANLVLYGKANPVDALEVIGTRVRGMHAKDGRYPTDPRKLGEEVPIGQGDVDFPKLFRRLKALKYTGPVTIEREISGPQQIEDIRRSITYLKKLIA